ncbi:MAG: MFS transporter [Actinomycetia bacterium]|nr:MFS transporter [Actinomycetes bacterium]
MRERLAALGAVLQNRSLRRVLAAFFLFNVVEWAAWVAVLVYAFSRGGTTEAGLAATVQLLPAALLAPFGAVFGDRIRRDRALALGYATQAVTMMMTALALWSDLHSWIVYAFAAAASSTIALTRPVHQAILPELADTPARLTAANASTSTLEGLGIFAGPVMTSILLGIAGPDAVLLACSLLAGVATLLTVRLHREQHLLTSASKGEASLVLEAIGGLTELRGSPGTSALLALVTAQFVVAGMIEILGISLALDVLDMGQSGPGLLLSAIGVGGLVGAVATTALVGRRRMTPGLAFGVLLTGIPLAVVAVIAEPWSAVLLLAASGVGKSFIDVAGRTLLQRTVPNDVLTRIFGIQEGVGTFGNAAGALAAPALVAVVGVSASFVATGALLPLLALFLWRWLLQLDIRAVLPGPDFDLVRQLPLFHPLPLPTLERMVSTLEVQHLDAGVTVITEGEEGDRFYLIADGAVRVTKVGRELNVLEPGDAFGEIALLRDVPRTATVVTIRATRLLSLQRDDFLTAVTGTAGSVRVADETIERHRRSDGALE